MQKMAEDSSPAFEEELNKCFVTVPQFRLAQFNLRTQCEGLEDKQEILDCRLMELDAEQGRGQG